MADHEATGYMSSIEPKVARMPFTIIQAAKRNASCLVYVWYSGRKEIIMVSSGFRLGIAHAAVSSQVAAATT